MKRKPISTRRQKRKLETPEPPRKGNFKVTREGWLDCARVALIEDGIDGVKVDRLAQRLKVTRGGFYHHFDSHQQLLDELLLMWKSQNRFTPTKVDVPNAKAACEALDRITDDLVHENGFDPQFDMAVREWGRIAHPVAAVLAKVDGQRIGVLTQIFKGMGYGADEAVIRARIYYMHQIGYYAMGVIEPVATREANTAVYIKVLAGNRYRGRHSGG